ncbi:hypothetical protein LINPERHAP1_LOCUS35754 [Linum perenne]
MATKFSCMYLLNLISMKWCRHLAISQDIEVVVAVEGHVDDPVVLTMEGDTDMDTMVGGVEGGVCRIVILSVCEGALFAKWLCSTPF